MSLQDLPILGLSSPPENEAHNRAHDKDKYSKQVSSYLYTHFPLTRYPLLPHFSKSRRVVSDDTIEPLTNAPCHQSIIIYRPTIDGAGTLMCISDESTAEEWNEEDAGEEVERDVRSGQEEARVGRGEANVGDGEIGEVGSAEGEILQL